MWAQEGLGACRGRGARAGRERRVRALLAVAIDLVEMRFRGVFTSGERRRRGASSPMSLGARLERRPGAGRRRVPHQGVDALRELLGPNRPRVVPQNGQGRFHEPFDGHKVLHLRY